MIDITEEITVDETRYYFTKYVTTKALEILHSLGKLLGKPTAQLLTAGMDADLKPQVVGSSIDHLILAMTPREFSKFISDIMENTEIVTPESKRRINFEADFRGRTGHLLKCVKRMISWQYDDFFAALASVAPELAGALQGKIQEVQGSVIQAL